MQIQSCKQFHQNVVNEKLEEQYQKWENSFFLHFFVNNFLGEVFLHLFHQIWPSKTLHVFIPLEIF